MGSVDSVDVSGLMGLKFEGVVLNEWVEPQPTHNNLFPSKINYLQYN